MWKCVTYKIITIRNNGSNHKIKSRTALQLFIFIFTVFRPSIVKYFPSPVQNSDIMTGIWFEIYISAFKSLNCVAAHHRINRINILLYAFLWNQMTLTAIHIALRRCHLMKAQHTTLPPPTPPSKATSSPLQPLFPPPLWYTCVKAMWQIAHIN